MPNISKLLHNDTDEVVNGAAAFFLNGHMLARVWQDQQTHLFLHEVIHSGRFASTLFTGETFHGSMAVQVWQQLKWLVEVNHFLHEASRLLSLPHFQEEAFPLSSAVWNTCLETPKGQACIARWKEKGIYIAMQRQGYQTVLHLSRHPFMHAAA